MKHYTWIEFGSYFSRDETQHYLRVGPATFKIALRDSVPWGVLHFSDNQVQLSKVELQLDVDGVL